MVVSMVIFVTRVFLVCDFQDGNVMLWGNNHTFTHTHTSHLTPHTHTHLTVLRPYKYAGYPMLIKTIERETSDDDLFSKSAPILTAASEVAFHTMNTSALNAEELRRENGIAVCYI